MAAGDVADHASRPSAMRCDMAIAHRRNGQPRRDQPFALGLAQRLTSGPVGEWRATFRVEFGMKQAASVLRRAVAILASSSSLAMPTPVILR